MSVQRLAATVKRTPLKQSLPQIFNTTKKRRSNQRGANREEDSQRVDIVDEQLCDHVISYLAPTLEQHKGCTIVDFEPGACLFSSKLHDLLKPKKHILLESDPRYFAPYIAPLLAQPNSTYQHATLPVTAHQVFNWPHDIRTHHDPNLLPDRTPFAPDDPERFEYDPSMLVLGNLAHRSRSGRNSTTINNSPSHQEVARAVLFHLSRAALAGTGVFEAGLVRMLWWLPDVQKNMMLAGNLPTNRTAFGQGLELAFQVDEVVGVQPLQAFQDRRGRQRRRLSVLERRAVEGVERRMAEAGVKVPEGRGVQRNGVVAEKGGGKDLPESLSPFENVRDNAEALDADITAAFACLDDVAKWAATTKVKFTGSAPLVEASLKSTLYPQSTTLDKSNSSRRDLVSTHPFTGARKTVFLDLGLRLLNLEASYQNLLTLHPKSPALPALKSRILDFDAAHSATMLQASDLIHRDVHELIEDQHVAFSNPPLLSTDTRNYHPLATTLASYYPPTAPLALLSFTPHPRTPSTSLSLPGLASPLDGAKLTTQLLHSLMRTRAQPLPLALEKIAVNAGKDLLPAVAATTDVRRGGRLNPMRLLSRGLTREMLAGIVRAWFEWPFRPEGWRLALADSGAGEAEMGKGRRRPKGKMGKKGEEDADDDDDDEEAV